MLSCPSTSTWFFLAASTPGFCRSKPTEDSGFYTTPLRTKLHCPIFAPTHGAVQRQNGAGKGTKVPAISHEKYLEVFGNMMII